jgi:hypothetical protein
MDAKMDPKSDQNGTTNHNKKLIFEIFGRSGRRCFSKVFGNPKNRRKIWKNPEKKKQGGADPGKITRPGGMRGASGEVRRG